MICQVLFGEVATRLAEVMKKVVEKELELEMMGIVVVLTGGNLLWTCERCRLEVRWWRKSVQRGWRRILWWW